MWKTTTWINPYKHQERQIWELRSKAVEVGSSESWTTCLLSCWCKKSRFSTKMPCGCPFVLSAYTWHRQLIHRLKNNKVFIDVYNTHAIKSTAHGVLKSLIRQFLGRLNSGPEKGFRCADNKGKPTWPSCFVWLGHLCAVCYSRFILKSITRKTWVSQLFWWIYTAPPGDLVSPTAVGGFKLPTTATWMFPKCCENSHDLLGVMKTPNQACLLCTRGKGIAWEVNGLGSCPASALMKCVLGQLLYFPVPISSLSKWGDEP